MSHTRITILSLLALALAIGLLASSPAGASNGGLSMRDARKAAVHKVERLQRKLLDTGARSSSVPGCWREAARRVACLGMVKGQDALVRWRCAVPMLVRKPVITTASTRDKLAVKFTDTLCSL